MKRFISTLCSVKNYINRPSKTDTDGDTYLDGMEVTYGFHPRSGSGKNF